MVRLDTRKIFPTYAQDIMKIVIMKILPSISFTTKMKTKRDFRLADTNPGCRTRNEEIILFKYSISIYKLKCVSQVLQEMHVRYRELLGSKTSFIFLDDDLREVKWNYNQPQTEALTLSHISLIHFEQKIEIRIDRYADRRIYGEYQ